MGRQKCIVEDSHGTYFKYGWSGIQLDTGDLNQTSQISKLLCSSPLFLFAILFSVLEMRGMTPPVAAGEASRGRSVMLPGLRQLLMEVAFFVQKAQYSDIPRHDVLVFPNVQNASLLRWLLILDVLYTFIKWGYDKQAHNLSGHAAQQTPQQSF